MRGSLEVADSLDRAGRCRAYLLRRLGAEEAARFEADFFHDSRLFLNLLAQEDSLIADYLRGDLPAADRRSFEECLAALPDLSTRVKEVQSALTREAEPPTSARSAYRFPLFSSGWPLAAAALLLCAFFGFELMRGKSPTGNARPTQPAIASFLLSSGLPKGADGANRTLAIPGEATQVSLQFALAANARPAPAVLQVMVREVEEGPQTWSGQAQAGASRMYRAIVPVSALRPGDYFLIVSNPETPDAAIVEYYFRTIRKDSSAK